MANCDRCGIEDIILTPDFESRRKTRDVVGQYSGYRVDMICENCGAVGCEAVFIKEQWVNLCIVTGHEELIPKRWAMDYVTRSEWPGGC